MIQKIAAIEYGSESSIGWLKMEAHERLAGHHDYHQEKQQHSTTRTSSASRSSNSSRAVIMRSEIDRRPRSFLLMGGNGSASEGRHRVLSAAGTRLFAAIVAALLVLFGGMTSEVYAG